MTEWERKIIKNSVLWTQRGKWGRKTEKEQKLQEKQKRVMESKEPWKQ